MEKAERQEAKVVKRKSGETGKRRQADLVSGGDERDEVVVLKKRIARLESENGQLREQIAVLTDSMGRSSQSVSDSVREQQHISSSTATFGGIRSKGCWSGMKGTRAHRSQILVHSWCAITCKWQLLTQITVL